jgi:hypothetical protein
MYHDIGIRIGLSFLIAGCWISIATLAGERLGSRVGGLVTNLPSNIVISLLFMSLTRGPDYAAQAAASVPVGMAIDTVFVLVFIALLPRGLGPALAASLAAWLGAAVLALLLPPLSLAWALVLYAVVCAASFAAAEFALRIQAVPKKPVAFRPGILVLRAVFAGGVVALAVTIAQLAPPYLTGIAATFPAVLLSTMVILSRGQGRDFARATGKILILSSSNIIVYALLASLLFTRIGPWWGSLAAFAAAALYVALIAPLTRRAA